MACDGVSNFELKVSQYEVYLFHSELTLLDMILQSLSIIERIQVQY